MAIGYAVPAHPSRNLFEGHLGGQLACYLCLHVYQNEEEQGKAYGCRRCQCWVCWNCWEGGLGSCRVCCGDVFD